MKRLFTIIPLLILTVASAQGQTFYWQAGNGDFDWWSESWKTSIGEGVPMQEWTNGSNVNFMGSKINVTVDQDVTVGKIQDSGSVIIVIPEGKKLTATDAMVEYYGKLSGPGTLWVESGFTFRTNLSSMDFTGTIDYNGGILKYNSVLSYTIYDLEFCNKIVLNVDNPIIEVIGNTTLNGVISGEKTLTVQGGGTLTLTGANTYTGGIIIKEGTVVKVNADALDDNITVEEGATVEISIDSDIEYSGVIIGAGKMVKSGTGKLTLTGANTFTGGTTIEEGTVIGNTTSLSGDITVEENATVELAIITDGEYSSVISGDGEMVKSGSGTLTLTGENTFTGGTTIKEGTVIGNTTSFPGDIAVDENATVELAIDDNSEYMDVISGDGTLVKSGSGTLTLTGANTFTGGTTIEEGTVIGNTTSFPGDIAVEENATVELAIDDNSEYSDVISGDGTLVKSGSGTLTIAALPAQAIISEGLLRMTTGLADTKLTLKGGGQLKAAFLPLAGKSITLENITHGSDEPVMFASPALDLSGGEIITFDLQAVTAGTYTLIDNLAEGTTVDNFVLINTTGWEELQIVNNQLILGTKKDISYHTITLEVAPGIDLHNLSAGQLTVEEDGHLQVQFLPEDKAATAADVLFLVDGVETAFKDFGGSNYFSYILNPVNQDHSILIAMREYTVTLPDIEGVTIDVGPGEHAVAYGDSFTFSLTAAEGVDPSTVHVYANGTEVSPTNLPQGEALRASVLPISSPLGGGREGAAILTYTIDKVIGPITITVEGADNPTGNTLLETSHFQLSTFHSQLLIETGEPQWVRIFNLSGVLQKAVTVDGQETISLSAGVYLVQAGQRVYKVVVH